MTNRLHSLLQKGLASWWRLAAVLAVLAAASVAATGAIEPEHPLPRLGRVADFALSDQGGVPVTRRSLLGKPWVASFFFTRCPTVCPVITSRMKSLEKAAAHDGEPLRLVSITVDPDHDGAAVLEEYAKLHQVDWSLLTGSDASVRALARSFAVAMEGKADPNALNYGILHSGHLVLVDGSGTIRGYYKSSEPGAEKRLLADVRRLDAAS